jgi:hypothetical protein
MNVKALHYSTATSIFLISNFRHILNVVLFLLDDSPASVTSILIIVPQADYYGYLFWSSEPGLFSTSRALSSDSLHHVSTPVNYRHIVLSFEMYKDNL